MKLSFNAADSRDLIGYLLALHDSHQVIGQDS